MELLSGDPPQRGIDNDRMITEIYRDVPPCRRLHGHQERMLGVIELAGYPVGNPVIAGEGRGQQGRRDALLDALAVLPLARGPVQAHVPQPLVAGPAAHEDLGDGIDPGAERVAPAAADRRHELPEVIISRDPAPDRSVDGGDDQLDRDRLACPCCQLLGGRVFWPAAGERIKRGGAGCRTLARVGRREQKVPRLLVTAVDLRDEVSGGTLDMVVAVIERDGEDVPGLRGQGARQRRRPVLPRG